MKIAIYVSSSLIFAGLASIAAASRYQMATVSLPSLSEREEVIVRLDRLTGSVCLAIGDDGYNYYSAIWTQKFNEMREIKGLFAKALPPQCG